jgi:hypothetical protein
LIPVPDDIARNGAPSPGPALPSPMFPLPPTPSVQDDNDNKVNNDDKIDNKVTNDGDNNNGSGGSNQNQKHRRESIKQRARAQTIEEGEVLAESVKKAKMGLRDEEL